jgi:hypothetical protein
MPPGSQYSKPFKTITPEDLEQEKKMLFLRPWGDVLSVERGHLDSELGVSGK